MNHDISIATPKSFRSSPFLAVPVVRLDRAIKTDGWPVTNEPVTADTAEGASALMHRLAENADRQAFEILFRHFAPRVKAYMLKLGTAESLADELAQETLLTVWRKAPQFDRSKASPSTWIFTIARNLRIDAFRKLSRPELDPNDPALVPDPEEQQDDRMDRLQRADVIRDAIRALNDDQAAVVRLSFFEDLSHSAIAERLDLPLGTVKSRLRLAFAKIRDVVGEDLE